MSNAKQAKELKLDRTDGQMHPDDEADLLEFVGDVRDAVRDVQGVATGMSHSLMRGNAQLHRLDKRKLKQRADRLRNAAGVFDKLATLVG